MNKGKKGYIGTQADMAWNVDQSDGLKGFDYEWRDDETQNTRRRVIQFDGVDMDPYRFLDPRGGTLSEGCWAGTFPFPILSVDPSGFPGRIDGATLVIRAIEWDVQITQQPSTLGYEPIGGAPSGPGMGTIDIVYCWERYNETRNTPDMFSNGTSTPPNDDQAPMGYYDKSNINHPFPNSILRQQQQVYFTILQSRSFELHNGNSNSMVSGVSPGATDTTLFYMGASKRIMGTLNKLCLPIQYQKNSLGETIRTGGIYLRIRTRTLQSDIGAFSTNPWKANGQCSIRTINLFGVSPIPRDMDLLNTSQGGPWGVDKFYPHRGLFQTQEDQIPLPNIGITLKDVYGEMAEQGLAAGGHLGGYSDGGRMLKGPGDGMSDNIPATIAGKQPARLADGEFVVPADVVSHLGNPEQLAMHL